MTLRSRLPVVLTAFLVAAPAAWAQGGPAAAPPKPPDGLTLGGGTVTPLAVTPKVGTITTKTWADSGGLWSSDGAWLILPAGKGTWHRVNTVTGTHEVLPVAAGASQAMGIPFRRDGDQVLYRLYDRAKKQGLWLSIPQTGGDPKLLATVARLLAGRRVLDVRLGRSGPCFFVAQQILRPSPRETLTLVAGSPTNTTGMTLPDLPPAMRVMAVSDDWSHVALAPMFSSAQQRIAIRKTTGEAVTLLPSALGGYCLPVFSPDNATVAVGNVKVPAEGAKAGDKKVDGVVAVALANPRKIQILHRGADYYSKPTFSPDGGYVAVNAMYHVWKAGTVIDHKSRMLILRVKPTAVAATQPVVTGYTGTGTSGDVRYDFGDPQRVLSVIARLANSSECSSWSADGTSLVHGGPGLLKFDTATGAMTTLITTDPDPVGGQPVGKINYWPKVVGDRVVYIPNSGVNVGGVIRTFHLAVPLAGGKPVPYLDYKIGWTIDDIRPGKSGVLLRKWDVPYNTPHVWHTTDAAAPDLTKTTQKGPLPMVGRFQTISLSWQRVAMSKQIARDQHEWTVFDVGGKPIATFAAARQIRFMALSPDGAFAAIVKGVYGRPQELLVTPLAEPTKEYPLAKDKLECSPPSWSPDGTRVAVIREYNLGVSFGRMRTERKLEIYKVGDLIAPPPPKPHR